MSQPRDILEIFDSSNEQFGEHRFN